MIGVKNGAYSIKNKNVNDYLENSFDNDYSKINL